MGYITIDERSFIEEVDMEPHEYPSEAIVETPVADEPEKPLEDPDVVLLRAFWDDAEEQGLKEDIEKAMEEHPEVHFGSVRGNIFVFRPLYWDEKLEILEESRKEKKEYSYEDLVRRCVLVGLDKIVGKRARAGLWEAIARRIDEVSDYETDMPPMANPPVERIK